MNILIPYSWLKEFLKTDLGPKEFASTISLYGPSIERWHKTEDDDVVFDVEITTNRIDAYSVFGLAREAHAILQYNNIPSTLVEPQTPELENRSGVKYELYAEVDETLCPRFTAVVLDGVSVGQSPDFIRERLEKVGERSLNNVVDITNYCMYELGQPMHVFDYDKILRHKMTLRQSREGESVTTLDNVDRDIPTGSIVIEDAQRLIDLAGIMGGKNSAVDENTERVLLFVQTYNPHVIRKTAMQLAHQTQAAARFEKDLDEESVLPAIKRAAFLLEEYAGGIVASELIDIYPHPISPKTVSVSMQQIQSMIGVAVSKEQVESILSLLGFEIVKSDDIIEVQIPSWRAKDIAIPQDLIEEIARMYGYHNIPSQIPSGSIPNRPENDFAKRVAQIKTALKFLGFTEIYTNSATSKENVEKTGKDPKSCVTIRNPLTEDFVYMRPNLLSTMLPVVSENLPRFSQLAIFELSRVYKPAKDELPKEITMLQIMTADVNLLKLKGVVESILNELHVCDVEVILDETSSNYDSGSNATFVHRKNKIGHLGLLSTSVLESFGISKPIASAKLVIDDIVELASDTIDFKPIPKFPALLGDLSFVVSEDQPVGPILDAVKKADNLVNDVTILDTFSGSGVGEGRKSITLRISYQSPTKLLAEKDVTKAKAKVEQLLKTSFDTTLRK